MFYVCDRGCSAFAQSCSSSAWQLHDVEQHDRAWQHGMASMRTRSSTGKHWRSQRPVCAHDVQAEDAQAVYLYV